MRIIDIANILTRRRVAHVTHWCVCQRISCHGSRSYRSEVQSASWEGVQCTGFTEIITMKPPSGSGCYFGGTDLYRKFHELDSQIHLNIFTMKNVSIHGV